VILCVGETLAEREAGRTQSVVEEQLAAVVSAITPDHWACVLFSSSLLSVPIPLKSTLFGIMVENIANQSIQANCNCV
jgi:hypothetical protein